MSKEWIDDDHYRVTSEDGSTSHVYKADGGLCGPDTCVEIADHHRDGTTDAYTPDNSVKGFISGGGRGEHK